MPSEEFMERFSADFAEALYHVGNPKALKKDLRFAAETLRSRVDELEIGRNSQIGEVSNLRDRLIDLQRELDDKRIADHRACPPALRVNELERVLSKRPPLKGRLAKMIADRLHAAWDEDRYDY